MTHGFLTIVLLTLYEARRRRLVLAAFLCALIYIVILAAGTYFALALPLDNPSPLDIKIGLAMSTAVALYAAHLFIVLIALVLALDTVSGEIQSGVMQAIASKPVSRADILIGKWMAYFIISFGFAVLLLGGVLTLAYVFGAYVPPNLVAGVLLTLLEIAFMLSLVIAGGTIFGTIVNGIVAFSFFAIAFVGGWIETIGAAAGSAGAHYVGVTLSLMSPGDAMWRLASIHLQPALVRYLPGTPFTSATPANQWMVLWTVGYSIFLLLCGLRRFSRRAL